MPHLFQLCAELVAAMAPAAAQTGRCLCLWHLPQCIIGALQGDKQPQAWEAWLSISLRDVKTSPKYNLLMFDTGSHCWRVGFYFYDSQRPARSPIPTSLSKQREESRVSHCKASWCCHKANCSARDLQQKDHHFAMLNCCIQQIMVNPSLSHCGDVGSKDIRRWTLRQMIHGWIWHTHTFCKIAVHPSKTHSVLLDPEITWNKDVSEYRMEASWSWLAIRLRFPETDGKYLQSFRKIGCCVGSTFHLEALNQASSAANGLSAGPLAGSFLCLKKFIAALPNFHAKACSWGETKSEPCYGMIWSGVKTRRRNLVAMWATNPASASTSRHDRQCTAALVFCISLPSPASFALHCWHEYCIQISSGDVFVHARPIRIVAPFISFGRDATYSCILLSSLFDCKNWMCGI